ncbi:MAG: hypothetical protein ACRC0L_04790, partial [Angustibacter sp.]
VRGCSADGGVVVLPSVLWLFCRRVRGCSADSAGVRPVQRIRDLWVREDDPIWPSAQSSSAHWQWRLEVKIN